MSVASYFTHPGQSASYAYDFGDGSHGLKDRNKVLANPRHEQYREMAERVEGQDHYRPYHPEEFVPEQVRFDNPKTRWKRAFEGAR